MVAEIQSISLITFLINLMIISPTWPQHQFIQSQAQFPAMVAGFGSGKTEAAVTKCLLRAFQHPKNDFGFYEPNYDLVRRIAWPRFEEKLTEANIPYKLIKSPENIIKIHGAGMIIFRSMEIPEKIIGYEVADSFADELDTLKPDKAAHAWRQIIARNRQKKADGSLNTASVSTTPEGFRFVYEQWELKDIPGHELIRASTYSNLANLPDGYIDSLKNIYPEHLLDAYLEGLFVNLTSGTVYRVFDRKKHHCDEVIKPKEPLFIGMDFNVENMSAVTHVRRERPVAADEITGVLDTPAMIEAIKERYEGHKINVYPDASGRSRKSVDANQTDLSLLRKAGFTVFAKKVNPSVRDRVNAMNGGFKNGYRVNTKKCPHYTRCLEQQVYSPQGEPDKTQNNDHLNDAAGYFIVKEMPIIKPVAEVKIGMAM